MSNIKEVHGKPRLSLFWSMAAMLGNSVVVVVVVVVRTRPRAIPLAMITIRKSTHGFPSLSRDKYGAPFGGPSGGPSSAKISAMNLNSTVDRLTSRLGTKKIHALSPIPPLIMVIGLSGVQFGPLSYGSREV